MKLKPTLGIIGMGKMGRAIVEQLEAKNEIPYHTFPRLSDDSLPVLKTCDVVIEFSTPEAAPDIIFTCLRHDIAVVSGTTGWHENDLERILNYCKERNGKFLYATNFSIGMNIVFALNEKLAELISSYPEFQPSLKEIHHVHKKDMPSGTAKTLLKGIMQQQSLYTDINLNENKSQEHNLIPVEAIREGEVKGYHEVLWNSDQEKISLSHEAFDRGIFASGAIMAALWLKDQEPGVYQMRDIIK